MQRPLDADFRWVFIDTFGGAAMEQLMATTLDGDPPADTRPAPHTLAQALKLFMKGPPRRSQRWVAGKLGVNQSYVSKLLQGKREASKKVTWLIHKLTGISMDVLSAPLPKKRHRKKPPPSAQ